MSQEDVEIQSSNVSQCGIKISVEGENVTFHVKCGEVDKTLTLPKHDKTRFFRISDGVMIEATVDKVKYTISVYSDGELHYKTPQDDEGDFSIPTTLANEFIEYASSRSGKPVTKNAIIGSVDEDPETTDEPKPLVETTSDNPQLPGGKRRKTRRKSRRSTRRRITRVKRRRVKN
jgi:hypothetical protein